jgi:HD-like signal output (HDOD) protein
MLNWLRGRNPGTDASEPAPAVDRRPTTGGVPLRLTGTPPNHSVSSLSDEIAARVHELLAELPESARRSDAPQVLRAIAGNLDTAIGQPPHAAQRALAVSRNPHSSVDDLARLFASDPGLARALLQHANSAFYARIGEPCVSLAAAVQRVGSTGVESVLLSSIVQGVLLRPGNRYSTILDQVWYHMVRSAPMARQLAPAFGVEPERAFSVALLHDAGKLVVLDQVSTIRRTERREVAFPEPVLLKSLKRLHEPIGALAALRWGMDERATRAIAAHHRDPLPDWDDPLNETLFVAEKLDLAATNGTALDLDALWAKARLTGDLSRAILSDDRREAA